MKKDNRTSKISIITVVFNNVENIEKTIKSVFNQTYKNIEYIVIDGGSTDGTIDIIKKYKKNIDYWISEPDKGIYDAMNKGAKKATGDYLYFLNSGDYFYDFDVLYNLSENFLENSDLVVGSVIKLYEDYKTLSKAQIHKLSLGVMPPHQGSFIKRKVFEELDGYNIKYKSSGDFDFFCKFYKSNYSYKLLKDKIAYMPSGGYSSQKNISANETAEVIKRYFGFFYSLLYRINKIFVEQGLKKILKNVEYCKKVKEKQKELLLSYNWEKIAEEYFKIFYEVVKK